MRGVIIMITKGFARGSSNMIVMDNINKGKECGPCKAKGVIDPTIQS